MTRRVLITKTAVLLAGGLFSLAAIADDAASWLEKMSDALRQTSYEGVLLREQGDSIESIKVYHTVVDGVVRERLVAQEGDGFEIIRNGDEVHCVLPEKRAVLVEAWDERSTLFSSLPRSAEAFGSVYAVDIEDQQRVAGRSALMLSIEPVDEMRFAHRVWLDAETGFPLRTELIDNAGVTLEQMRFADIEINAEISPDDLESQHDLSSFKWYPEAEARIQRPVVTDWLSEDLPSGFLVESSHEEVLDGSDATVTHIVYSDGLSKVSVFIETAGGNARTLRSRVGGSHSFSTVVGEHQVTAVGEVPAQTVERIALSMRPRR